MHATRNADLPEAGASAPNAGVHPEQREIGAEPNPTSVSTSMLFAAPGDIVWETILFYEQIDRRPPAYLQWLLPVPLGTEGRKTKVGDEARCLYESGYLVKRVTHVEPGRCFRFEVSEQALSFGGGMKLSGGDYQLHALPDGLTEVSLTTRYDGGRRPRWLHAPIEATVCHIFHRHILRAMRDAALRATRDTALHATPGADLGATRGAAKER